MQILEAAAGDGDGKAGQALAGDAKVVQRVRMQMEAEVQQVHSSADDEEGWKRFVQIR